MPLFIKYVFVNYNEFSSEKKKAFQGENDLNWLLWFICLY